MTAVRKMNGRNRRVARSPATRPIATMVAATASRRSRTELSKIVQGIVLNCLLDLNEPGEDSD